MFHSFVEFFIARSCHWFSHRLSKMSTLPPTHTLTHTHTIWMGEGDVWPDSRNTFPFWINFVSLVVSFSIFHIWLILPVNSLFSFSRDLQSYLSRISIFLAFESKKLFILVDNQPWSVGKDASPVHLWQLMVTKVGLDINCLCCCSCHCCSN